MKWAAIALVWLLGFSMLGWAQQVHKNTLTWPASSWANVVYRIYRGPKNGPYVRIAGGVLNLKYVDRNVVSGQVKCYRVTAYKRTTKEESGYSPEACGVTP